MITVIIPALNESKTIRSVVDFAWSDPRVTEVIVIDDGSIDGTGEIALSAGATVIMSTLLGKGASMEDGVWLARNEFLVFLDGDLSSLADDLIVRLIRPLANSEADFVKAKFSRSAGRVTTLTAKPLLKSFFPEVAHFDQPLGGIIAARRSLLRRIRFEIDYGVDIGLLLDIFATRAAIAEVDIGHIEHDGQSLEALGEMATQVARTILDRAERYGRLHLGHIQEAQEAERSLKSDLSFVVKKIGDSPRLALFDLDGTLVRGRFISRLAERTKKTAELAPLLDCDKLSPVERTRKIAAMFAGTPRAVFEEIARQIPLASGAVETIVGLRKLGYCVGIVTDGFDIVAEIIRRRVFADFSIGHLLEFRGNQATGEVVIAPAMVREPGCEKHSFCKSNVARGLIEQTHLTADDLLAVGDGENDICLFHEVADSVAFQPKSVAVKLAADRVAMSSLLEVLEFVQSTPSMSA